MSRIRHDTYELNPIYRVILPRWKQYRFRFISPRLFCLFAIVYIPVLPYSTFFWLCISLPCLYFIYHNNSFFIDRCDEIIFGVKSTSIINNKSINNNEQLTSINLDINKTSITPSTITKTIAKNNKTTITTTTTLTPPAIKRRKSLTKTRKSLMKKPLMKDLSIESDDDFLIDYNSEYGIIKQQKNSNKNSNKNSSNDNNCSSDCTSSSVSKETLPIPIRKNRSFTKSSLKNLFKCLSPSMTTNSDTCDTQHSDFDQEFYEKKYLKRFNKNTKQISSTRTIATSSMRLSPFWKPKTSSIIDQDNRRAISIPDLTTIDLNNNNINNNNNNNDSCNEQTISESLRNSPVQIQTDDDQFYDKNTSLSKITKNRSVSSSDLMKKMKKEKIKNDLYRINTLRQQYLIQSDDSYQSDINNNNNNVITDDDQNDEPIMMKIDNRKSLNNNQNLLKQKIQTLQTNQTFDNLNEDENENKNFENNNDDSNIDDGDDLSITTLTEMNVLNNKQQQQQQQDKLSDNNNDDAKTTENKNNDNMRLQRIHQLLQYPFFQIDVNLKYGENLLAKDSGGTSDPYVKFIYNNRVIYKSQTKYKTLNPKWDEYFVLSLDNVNEPLIIKVFDYDLFFTDDYLGMAYIDLTRLEPGVTTDLKIRLCDKNNNNTNKNNLLTDNIQTIDRGHITLSIRLNPKTHEERDYYYGRGKWTKITSEDGRINKRIKSQPYDSIVTVVLIKGDNIELDHDYCVRMKLGMEKFKSKTVSKHVRSPYWAEQFDLHIFADQSKVLEITLGYVGQQYQKELNNRNVDFIDKVCTDLSELEPEHTHHFIHEFNLNNSTTTATDKANIEVLITITGLNLTTMAKQQNAFKNIQMQQQQQRQIFNFKQLISMANLKDLNNLYQNFFDIGTLIVKVHRAENLASADMNGKSDPFCVLELVNQRLRTSTDYKTLFPVWNKLFEFKIKDIHDVLEVTIFDEDKDRVEFLGKVAIPLLKIRNGEKQWYALKDKKLKHRAKGNVCLECWIQYNQLKAGLLTFTPRPTKYVQKEIKFKRSLLIRNSMRLKNILFEFVEIAQFLHSCIQWESPTRSILAFITFVASVYYFEFYMIPLVILLYILMNYIGIRFKQHLAKKNGQITDYDDSDNYYDEYIDETKLIDDDDDDEKGDEKKSFKEKLHTVQDLSTLIMLIVGYIASYIERCKNATNFTVPYLSWLAVICLSFATITLYFIHVRYLILLWGINKFTKKFRSPNSINNNEIIDFLSRVPDMEEKIMYKQFKPTITTTKSDQDLNHQT